MTRVTPPGAPVDLRRAATGVLPLVVAVAVLAYLLPQFTDVSDVWHALRSMTWFEVTTLAKLALPVVALAWLALRGDATPGRVAAAAGVAGLLGTAFLLWTLLRSEASARRLGLTAQVLVSRLRAAVGRAPVTGWERATTTFRSRTVLLLQARWGRLAVATLVSHLSLFLVLWLALRHVGVCEQDVATAEALAVFALARLLTAVPVTPGGVGDVEMALVTGLDAAGGGDAQVVAAVLAFRALTYVLPVPLGLLAYLYWRGSTAWRPEPGQAPRTALVPEVR